jgi:hypothetical protein
MQSIKRVEIVVPRSEVDALLVLFNANEVEGYTLIGKVKGMGHRGIQDGLGLTDAFTNSMIIWYCEPEKFESLKEAIRIQLEESGGICAVSDASWVMH